MRRKSERNKSKGSPEKKVEKATRKSTRKRGKRATSSSPERDDGEGKSADVAKVTENANEAMAQQATRLKIRELKTITEENLSGKQISSSTTEPVLGTEKGQEGAEGASVWKVARADASPGEIQKLKLCRQRNPSEASDSSSSRKKSHKSYESGEGDGEEGDSGEELPRSRKINFGGERQDDPSSSNSGQDSKEEVSHCREIQPRTTSANFSDDKQNVDRLTDNADQAIRYDQNCPIQKSPERTGKEGQPSSNGGDCDDGEAPVLKQEASEDIVKEGEEGRKVGEEEEEGKIKLETEDGIDAAVIQPNQPLAENSQADGQDKVATKVEHTVSSSDQHTYKRQESESASEAKLQAKRSDVRTSLRTARRKHRTKYHESSDSDTPESEDEPSEKKAEISKVQEEYKEILEAKTRTPSPENRLSFSTGENAEPETAVSDATGGEINTLPNDKPHDETSLTVQPAEYKPAKVNLKRSFSSRLTELEEVTKHEDAEKNGENEASLQPKENHLLTEETEMKNLPRKRRWGTSVIAEATPAFTVSTDSLKALVPGAKPLSITEVRLSKDEDEEKARRREREKRHSTSDDSEEHKVGDDDATSKNERAKKGDLKHDNHIGAKRKISILKEAPRVKSPSPPSATATNVLLIKNLVRPFTLNQIKELLSRTGTIIENGFWIDGIKSKCYVVYSNEDQAFETRQALHGISWPVSNPKRLHVEYASKQDMEFAREKSKDQQPPVRKVEPLLGSDTWQQVWAREEKQNVAVKVATVREWDLGKEDGHQVKEKEREKKDLERKRRQRSRSPLAEPHLPPPARKFKKKEDEPPPAKLLDDLFKKTKAIPYIYWLPLTNEQIVVKEEMRRQHMAEHARRLEEMKRAERSRDPAARRRRSPRK